MSVIEEIAAERRRQVEVKGFTSEHDDQRDKGELARAALNYVGATCITLALGAKGYDVDTAPPLNRMGFAFDWPWPRLWWRPSGARRMLIKAAALIVAEIERLDRASPEGQSKQGESL